MKSNWDEPMSRKILSERPVSLERVKHLLGARSESGELNYIQRVTLEYAHKFSRHFPHSEEMIELLGENYQISREEAIQLINSDPKRVEEVTLILEDRVDESMKKEIVNLFKEHKTQYAVEEEEDEEVVVAEEPEDEPHF